MLLEATKGNQEDAIIFRTSACIYWGRQWRATKCNVMRMKGRSFTCYPGAHVFLLWGNYSTLDLPSGWTWLSRLTQTKQGCEFGFSFHQPRDFSQPLSSPFAPRWSHKNSMGLQSRHLSSLLSLIGFGTLFSHITRAKVVRRHEIG